MTTMTRDSPQVLDRPPTPELKETTDLRIPEHWLEAPPPAKETPPRRRWPIYVLVGLVAGLIGLLGGYWIASARKADEIAAL